MKKRAVITTLIAAGALLLGASGGASAQDPEPEASALVSVEPQEVAPGADFTVTLVIEGTFPVCTLVGESGADAVILPEPVTPLGVLPGDEPRYAGTFSAPTEPGEYSIGARYVDRCGANIASSATLIVVEEETTTTSAPTTTESPTSSEAPTSTGDVTPTTAAPPPATAPDLPATGSTTSTLAWLALAAVLLGGGFVTVAARRS